MSSHRQQTRAKIRLAPPPLGESIQSAQDLLLKQQSPEGYWWYTLQANETIGSGLIMLEHFLATRTPANHAGLCRRLLDEQRPDGSWTVYHDGPGDLSATVEAYLALRLAGYHPEMEPLLRARRFVLSQGGLEKVRIFTRIHLALFGLISWLACPEMPVWLILLPVRSQFSIYEFSSWARASIVPLLLLMTKKPVRPLPFDLQELSHKPPNEMEWNFTTDKGKLSWENFFIIANGLMKQLKRLPWHPGQRWALRSCEKWTREHLERTEDIYPALAYGVLGLSALGYPPDDPQIAKGLRALRRFQQVYDGELPAECDPHTVIHPLDGKSSHVSKLERPDHIEARSARIHQQCCISPLWDTPWAATALLNCQVSKDHPALKQAARLLLAYQITDLKGDWAKKNPNGPAAGWAFEFENDYFPDVDDTIQILNVLKAVNLPESEKRAAIERGLAWLLSMQSANGGWAAFDVNNTANWVNHIPFSDHGACLDPPTADVTGRMIGLLSQSGYTQQNEIVQRALRFIEGDQRICNHPTLSNFETGSDEGKFGAWWGRWGVNYIYGTWCVLEGLAQIGIASDHAMIQRAVYWLKAVQSQDGGWGESCDGYRVNHFVPLTHGVPSQTSWALLGLIAAGEAHSDSVKRGIEFLQTSQRTDGGWDEPEHTGTGFPGHFYLRYHGYRHYFPLLALGKYANVLKKSNMSDH